ncbi:3'(2'),5'-bisphosphate nucleotidase 1-like protein [Drosera capensis]
MASPYSNELAAAKKAATLAALQRSLLQSDVQSKLDKTLLRSLIMAVVSFILERELPSQPFSLVAEENSGDLRNDGAQEILDRIRHLVNDTLTT